MILLELIGRFFMTGLFAIGGGLATLPFLYEMSNTTHWFTHADIANMIADGVEVLVVVAIDAVGAGEGEVVMTVGGSSSRQTNITENKPVDQSIIAIIDHVDVNGKRIFEKFNKES